MTVTLSIKLGLNKKIKIKKNKLCLNKIGNILIFRRLPCNNNESNIVRECLILNSQLKSRILLKLVLLNI